MSVDNTEEPFSELDGVLYDEQVKPEHGILGFTLRELLIVGAWLIAFVVSFFPVYGIAGSSIWSGIDWLLPIGVPTAAVFLIILRRFSPDGIRRVGSLGIDQFASVAFSVAAILWVQTAWDLVASWSATGIALPAWVVWVEIVALLALVVLTVFAPLIPGLNEDFRGRLVTLAHRNANPVRPVIARPRPERPAPAPAAAPAPASAPESSESADADDADAALTEQLDASDVSVPLVAHASGGELGTFVEVDDDYVPGYARSRTEPEAEGDESAASPDDVIHELFDDAAATQADTDVDEPGAPFAEPFQPFWILARTERDVHDAQGEPLFRIGPDSWALVVEDRGGAYVIRHDDGRIGYLHDIDDITKG